MNITQIIDMIKISYKKFLSIVYDNENTIPTIYENCLPENCNNELGTLLSLHIQCVLEELTAKQVELRI